MEEYICKIATIEEIEENWNYLIDIHPKNNTWKVYKDKSIKNAQENLNIFRKMRISIHKKYLKDKKKTVKSNMFNCLLNDDLILDVIGNITRLC